MNRILEKTLIGKEMTEHVIRIDFILPKVILKGSSVKYLSLWSLSSSPAIFFVLLHWGGLL